MFGGDDAKKLAKKCLNKCTKENDPVVACSSNKRVSKKKAKVTAESYEVEAIVDSRIHYRKYQYQIKWKGIEEVSWENAVGSDNEEVFARQEAFHKKNPNKPRQ